MRIKFLLIALLTSVIGFSQSVNDYKAVIVPLKYDFLKTENQYRLSTMTKANLVKAGFQAFYANEQLPAGFADRCDLLYVDVKRDNGFLITKLYLEFRDCYGKVIYTSQVGKSKEKEYESAYRESLELAFVSINALNYKYNGTNANTAKVTASVPATPQNVAASVVVSAPVADITDPNLLYAQPTENGYQLIDKTPKVVMKLLKTSRPDSFIAIKDGIQGSLNAKDNQWFFEYYKNDQLISEKVVVKF
ncbi:MULTISPECIES: hypothetical protein [unclassified Flavobacterium]|uniref:hypothetical protein n=1 Tax=unclassified Flavobacterium TaxID=196869 RepID=UPI0012A85A9E|nr:MULTISPECIES: hypothetical protein [unclassified Flavobacterium]MBF4485933.1 hypothetical protein [Flavobacterium sp. CSZ]QGK76794.1 hypothetical protein GIY83_22780 [Flavobacterium sp. SLB02]